MNGHGNVMIGVVMSVKMDTHGQMENVRYSVEIDSVEEKFLLMPLKMTEIVMDSILHREMLVQTLVSQNHFIGIIVQVVKPVHLSVMQIILGIEVVVCQLHTAVNEPLHEIIQKNHPKHQHQIRIGNM